MLGEFGGHIHGRGFVAIVHADENHAALGQRSARAQLRLAERFAEIFADAHHFARRSHLRPQRRIDAREIFRTGTRATSRSIAARAKRPTCGRR